MLNTDAFKAYEFVSSKRIDELAGEGYLLRHKKTGARVLLVDNDDKNKVFSIAFRTPPADDTGVAHILEHSVLCGSKNFPSKDPFVELAKGSLNTFLNAMTYSDKTVYPIASCNDKDYHNLMHVYLDAVFYPNIYSREEILRQEGWHYEIEDKDDELKFNGVVYNEMKGVFSSAEDVLARKIQSSLLKDTPYSFESGGDPDAIPELTRENFLSFHSRYYHPSNSYIYLYGNVDFEKELDFIDREYLSHFDYLPVDSHIALQAPYQAPETVEDTYSLASSEEDKDGVYLSYNVVCGNSSDVELMMALQILDYVLLSMPGAPVKKALISAGLGREVESSFDPGIQQPVYSVIVKNVDKGREADFIRILEDELGKLIREGINKKAIYSAINSFEFKYREADFGRYPKGLIYGLNFLNTWLYDDDKAMVLSDSLTLLAALKEKVETGYFEGLIEKYILDNPHKTYVNLYPEPGKNDRIEERLKSQLAKVKESLNKKQLYFLINDYKKLKEFQETPSSQEDLLKIPMLSISDIGRDVLPFSNEEMTIGGVSCVAHDYQTNGIIYTDFTFDVTDLPEELIPYSSLLVELFRFVDTTDHTYNELATEINLRIGGISFSTGIQPLIWKKDGYRPYFSIRMKCLEDQIADGMDIMREILFSTRFDDTVRMKEILSEMRSKMDARIPAAGHLYAANRVVSYTDPMMRYKEIGEGIDFYDFVKEMDDHYDKHKDDIVRQLIRTVQCIFRKENLILGLTGEFDFPVLFEKELASFSAMLYDTPCVKRVPVLIPERRNEGFKSSSKVQYVATGGRFETEDCPYTGALRVLRTILSYEYLWVNVRVSGGAYGCMCNFSRNGYGFLTSYRDPKLTETLDVYRKAADFVREFDATDRDMTKYIIGTISGMDIPLEPVALGDRSFGAYLCGVSKEMIAKEREQVLTADQETIRSLAPYLDNMLSSGSVCAIGNEKKISEASETFDQLRNLTSTVEK